MTPTAATTTLESLNPATGVVIGAVQTTAPGDVQEVVDAVAKVQPFWAQLTLRDRARYMERAAQVLIDESDEIRDLIVAEQGKPRNEAFAMELSSRSEDFKEGLAAFAHKRPTQFTGR